MVIQHCDSPGIDKASQTYASAYLVRPENRCPGVADFSAEYVKGRVFRFAEAACYFIDVLGEREIVIAGAACSPGLLCRDPAIMRISAGCMVLYSCSGQSCSQSCSFILTLRLPAFALCVSVLPALAPGRSPVQRFSLYTFYGYGSRPEENVDNADKSVRLQNVCGQSAADKQEDIGYPP